MPWVPWDSVHRGKDTIPSQIAIPRAGRAEPKVWASQARKRREKQAGTWSTGEWSCSQQALAAPRARERGCRGWSPSGLGLRQPRASGLAPSTRWCCTGATVASTCCSYTCEARETATCGEEEQVPKADRAVLPLPHFTLCSYTNSQIETNQVLDGTMKKPQAFTR